ncbi:MAG: hypothetical protein HN916_18235 [Anaerolineae bacterium]|jgi:hypothetical protein|nr:hypothetical protein [Anaerolineae bacterium]
MKKKRSPNFPPEIWAVLPFKKRLAIALKIMGYKLINNPHIRIAATTIILSSVAIIHLPEHPIAIPAAYGTVLSGIIIFQTLRTRSQRRTIAAHWV